MISILNILENIIQQPLQIDHKTASDIIQKNNDVVNRVSDNKQINTTNNLLSQDSLQTVGKRATQNSFNRAESTAKLYKPNMPNAMQSKLPNNKVNTTI